MNQRRKRTHMEFRSTHDTTSVNRKKEPPAQKTMATTTEGSRGRRLRQEPSVQAQPYALEASNGVKADTTSQRTQRSISRNLRKSQVGQQVGYLTEASMVKNISEAGPSVSKTRL